MSRRPTHYAGATKRVALRELGQLGSRWVVQPKKDGIYARVCLDGRGRIVRVFMRNGSEAPAHLTAHLRGALVGFPHAELVGELEAMTEQAERRARDGQIRRIHLFDCLFDGSRNLVRAPYHVRRAALWRMNAAVQCYAPDDNHVPAPWRRYRAVSPPGWRLCPVIDQVPVAASARAWEEWVVGPEDGDEGLVAVNLDAPVSGRAAKLKVKQTDTVDAVVAQVSPSVVIARWNGHLFSVARGRHVVDVGETVEVACDGFYETSVTPKFARLVRVRRDLQ